MQRRFTHNARLALLVFAAMSLLLAAVLAPPILQPRDYHQFADQREFMGVPNFLDTVSNLPLLAVGLAGVWLVLRAHAANRQPFHLLMFAAIAATGLASVYYHLAPDDGRLLWDRLAMATLFAALAAVVLAGRAGNRIAGMALAPMLALAWVGVAHWYASGQGDLRFYALVQLYPAVLVPLALLLFPRRHSGEGNLLVALAWYGVAMLGELFDRQIYLLGGMVSGHTLKHVFAAVAAYWLLRGLR